MQKTKPFKQKRLSATETARQSFAVKRRTAPGVCFSSGIVA